jgi:hypothetical protein
LEDIHLFTRCVRAVVYNLKKGDQHGAQVIFMVDTHDGLAELAIAGSESVHVVLISQELANKGKLALGAFLLVEDDLPGALVHSRFKGNTCCDISRWKFECSQQTAWNTS